MAEINHINLSALKSLKSEFDGEHTNFKNNTYSKFTSSYFFTTSNPIVSKMGSSLERIYKEISKGYKNIDKWWSSYNISVEELENLLARKSNGTSELDSSIISIVNQKLRVLENSTGKTDLSTGMLASSIADTKSLNVTTSINTDFSSLYVDYVETVPFEEQARSTFIATGATVANATLGFVEGVGEFGEGIYDAGVVVQTAIKSVPTAAIDFVKLGANEFLGTDFESTTAAMWEDTKAHVAKKHVDSFFSDVVRGDNLSGDFLRLSYYYEEVRGVSSSIGYMSAAIAVSAATGIPPAGLAGAAGFGQGTEKAWAEGASVSEGLMTGTFTGLKDGIQYLIGGKMAQVGAPFATKFFSGTTLKVIDGGFRAVVDGATGAAETAFVPLIDAVYKKGFYDETGNYSEFTDQSLIAKYKELFSDAGGWSSVKQGAIAGVALSGLMETIPVAVTGIKSKLKTSQKTNVETTIKAPFVEKDFSDLELSFFSNFANFGGQKTNALGIDLGQLSKDQIDLVKQINTATKKNTNVIVEVKSTKELSSLMFDKIDNLDNVNFKIIDGLGDLSGQLKSKYHAERYIDRITYSGYETKSIIAEIEKLSASIDNSLPIRERAYQIYNLVSSEIPVMRDYANFEEGHKISGSLRGIVAENSVGKKGLVCAGYSSVFKEICERNGIVCDYIRGSAMLDPLTGASGIHAWNVVVDGDEIIPIDVTWKASGGSEWFGKSEKISASRVADPDELYNSYKPDPEINSKIDSVIENLDSKHGSGQGVKVLESYLKENNINLITRTNDSREIVRNIDVSDIKKYFDNRRYIEVEDKINSVVSTIDLKYGNGQGIKVLETYLNEKDINLITRTNDSREIVRNMDASDIKKYFDNRRYAEVEDKINSVVSTIDLKNGSGEGIMVLETYLKTKELNIITRTNDSREIVGNMDISDIKKYFENRRYAEVEDKINFVIKTIDLK